MNRRQSLLTSIASLFGLGCWPAADPPTRDNIDAVRHPRTGDPQARVYRYDRVAREWREIAHADIREGDHLLSIGVSDGRLWKLETMRASSGVRDHDRGYRIDVSDQKDLLP